MGDTPRQEKGRPPALSPERHSGVVTLLFTDVVGSTALKERLGDRAGVDLIHEHHSAVRRTLEQFPGAEEIVVAGDSFLVVFPIPSDAVRCALVLQMRLAQFNQGRALPVMDRMGLHMGEVRIEQTPTGQHNVHGIQVDTCARVMSLGHAGQVLMTRAVFDNARQSLKGEEIEGISGLEWLNHGRFELKGVEEPVEICEVRPAGTVSLSPPATSEKARRVESAEDEAVLGWRPAAGNVVPTTQWVLEDKLGEGGFGEVWLGRHQVMKERRVFKFCFRADRVRSLKREMTLFRLIKERIGDHPNIVALREVYFEQPPYYVEEEYVAGQSLIDWCAAQGGADKVPLEMKLEIIAQIADALQAAHDAGVIHRDVKPANILVASSEAGRAVPSAPPGTGAVGSPNGSVGTASPTFKAKLTDFGIGQVVSEEALAGVTKAGFTQTMLSSSSSHSGTQLYMAPELLAGNAATIRSDIYSLGVVLYQLLLGDFHQPVTTDWGKNVPNPLLREDLEHCFAGEPEERFSGARQLAQNLRSLPQRRESRQKALRLERRAEQRHRVAMMAGALAGILLLLACALLYGLKRAQAEALNARRIAYASDMNAAWEALRDNNLDQVQSLLDAQIPEPGQQDLRHWEWRYLWQQCRGEQLWTLGPVGEKALGLAVLPGERLAIGATGVVRPGSQVHIWDLKRQEILQTRKVSGSLSWLAASADGRRLAVATWHPTIQLLDGETLEPAGELQWTNPVCAIAISPKGDLLSAAGGRDDVSVWDLTTLRLVWAMQTPSHNWEAAFLPDGESLVLDNFRSGTCARVGARDGKVIWEHPAPSTSCVAASADGRWVALGGWDGRLVLLETLAGQSRELANYQVITALAFSHDSRKLAVSSIDRIVRLWNPESGEETRCFHGHRKAAWRMSFSADDQQLFTASDDGTVCAWDVSTPPALEAEASRSETNRLGDDISREELRLITRDSRLMAAISTNAALRIWSLETLREIGRVQLSGLGRALALSLDGRYAAAGDSDGRVAVWETNTGKLSWSFTAHSNRIDVLEFSPTSDRLATAARGAEVRLWRYGAAQPEFTRVLGVPGAGVGDMAFTPDGRRLAILGYGNLHLLGLEPGGVDRQIPFPCDNMYAIAISRDGALMAAGGNQMVCVWELRSLRRIATLRGSLGSFVSAVSFSPDGRRLIASDQIGVSWLWDLATGRVLGRFGPSEFKYAHFQPGGETIVIGRSTAPTALHVRNWGGLTFLRAPTWAEIAQTEKADTAERRRWGEPRPGHGP